MTSLAALANHILAMFRRAYLTLGSSGVVTTPEDFTRYLLFRLNNGQLDGKQIVPKVSFGTP